MGCPDKQVIKTGSGSALILNSEIAGELIKAAKTGGLPISVKTRIGYSSVNEWQDWLSYLLSQDIANLTIHLRTRKEMSKPGSHYELIPEIKRLRDEIAPHTLLTINGDIRDRQHGEELAKQYGIDGIMIGRGVFNNPFAFEIAKREHTREELFELLRLHLDLHDKYSSDLEPRKFDPLKRFLKIYIHGFPGSRDLRDKLMHAKNTDEVREIINNISSTD